MIPTPLIPCAFAHNDECELYRLQGLRCPDCPEPKPIRCRTEAGTGSARAVTHAIAEDGSTVIRIVERRHAASTDEPFREAG